MIVSYKKNKRWDFNLISLAMVVAITAVLLSSVFNYGYNFINRVQERDAILKVNNVMTNFDIANFTGKWFWKDRIKYQIMLLRDEVSYIDIYYYREFFERDVSSWQLNPTPQYEFYWMRRFDFGDNILIDFDHTNLNWNALTLDSDESNYILWIKRELPKNDLTLFDASVWYFNKLNEAEKRIWKEFSIFWQWNVELYEWWLLDETEFDLIPWVLISNIWNITANVTYKWDRIWRIILDSDKKQIYFTNKNIAWWG